LASALDDMALSSHDKGPKRSYVSANKLASVDSLPADAFMPIKALNQFSTDWVIKARVLKKGDIR